MQLQKLVRSKLGNLYSFKRLTSYANVFDKILNQMINLSISTTSYKELLYILSNLFHSVEPESHRKDGSMEKVVQFFENSSESTRETPL